MPRWILCSFRCESSTQSSRTRSSDGWKVLLSTKRWLVSTVEQTAILSRLMAPFHEV